MDKLELCKIEELEAQHKTREISQQVQDDTGPHLRRAENSCITSIEVRVLFVDQQEIQNRWKEYIEELFADDRGEIPQMNNTDGPVILKEEVNQKDHKFLTIRQGPWRI